MGLKRCALHAPTQTKVKRLRNIPLIQSNPKVLYALLGNDTHEFTICAWQVWVMVVITYPPSARTSSMGWSTTEFKEATIIRQIYTPIRQIVPLLPDDSNGGSTDPQHFGIVVFWLSRLAPILPRLVTTYVVLAHASISRLLVSSPSPLLRSHPLAS